MIITLIGSPGLPGDLVERVARALNIPGAPDWLGPGEACELFPDEGDPREIDAMVRAALEDAPVDVVIHPRDRTRHRLFLADMDSTIVQEETLDELADAVGLKERIAAITARAMNGELDFAEALQARVAMLKDLPVDALQATLDRVRLMPGAATLLATLKHQGVRCVLVSGGFTFFTGAMARKLGFDAHFGNTLEVIENRLSGRVVPPILGREAKLKRLRSECKALGVAVRHAVAIGDGANDLPMLKAAGLGLAFRARPSVRSAAPARLNHADLTGVLYAMGLRQRDFAHAQD